jgi:hypothetical protein
MTPILKYAALIVVLFVNGSLVGQAQASEQASLSLGMATFGGGLLGATGYSLIFQSQPQKGYLRPTMSGELTKASGTAGIGSVSLYSGDVGFGAGIYLSKSSYVTPFINPEARLGWASLTTGSALTQKSIGLSYGVNLGGGVAIRLKDDASSKALLISTGYTIMSSTLAQTSSFTNFQIAVGIIF